MWSRYLPAIWFLGLVPVSHTWWFDDEVLERPLAPAYLLSVVLSTACAAAPALSTTGRARAAAAACTIGFWAAGHAVTWAGASAFPRGGLIGAILGQSLLASGALLVLVRAERRSARDGPAGATRSANAS